MIIVEYNVSEVVVKEYLSDRTQPLILGTLPVAWLPEIIHELVKTAPQNRQWLLANKARDGVQTAAPLEVRHGV